jgi:ribosomal protein S18 acetylase RimI-like enzyme
MGTEIRKANESDLNGMIELWKDFMDYHIAFDRFWTRSDHGHESAYNYIKSILDEDNVQVLVASMGNRIIGYQISQILEHPPVLQKTRYCLVNDIAIDDKYRGRGIGSEMFEEVKKWAKQKGVDRMELQVASGNEKAIRFYEKQGMKPYSLHMYLTI